MSPYERVKRNLVWCLRNPLNNLRVIPGKLAIASATRNLGIFKDFWMPAFASMTGRGDSDFFCEFSSAALDHPCYFLLWNKVGSTALGVK